MPLRRLPPLTSLRAFEAAGRRLSFKAAAEELAVTPGAVSQQIRSLEDDLGVALFTRSVRSVSLTPSGQELLPELSSAFMRINQAVAGLRDAQQRSLRINSSAPVIIKWLLPRLHRFAEAHPDLDISVETEYDLVELGPDGPDITLRFTQRPQEGIYTIDLHDELLLPLASPELIERLDICLPNDILRAPLLTDTSLSLFDNTPGWEEWFQAAGLDAPAKIGRVRFEKQAPDYAIDAAIAGAGVVLGRSLLAFDAMRDGRLICPFGPVLDMGASYFACCMKGQETRPAIRAFLEWAKEEAAILSTLRSLQLAAS